MVAGAGLPAGLYRTSDGGFTWHRVTLPGAATAQWQIAKLTVAGNAIDVAATNENIGAPRMFYLRLAPADTVTQLPVPSSCPRAAQCGEVALSGPVAWVIAGSTLNESSDQGASWRTVSASTPALSAPSIVNTRDALATALRTGCSSGDACEVLVVTHDSGHTWHEV